MSNFTRLPPGHFYDTCWGGDGMDGVGTGGMGWGWDGGAYGTIG